MASPGRHSTSLPFLPFRILEWIDRLGHRFGFDRWTWFQRGVCDEMDADLLAHYPDNVTPSWTPESRRIANERLCDALLGLWDLVPDQRFGQLVMNLSREPGGFADTWEWSHADWYRRIEQAAGGWANELHEAQRAS